MKKYFIILLLCFSVVFFSSCDTEKSTQAIETETTYNDDIKTTVYVSNSKKIHKNPSCSGMKKYKIMDYDEAISKGYSRCKKCY